MEPDLIDILLANLANQFRKPLSSLYLGISLLAPSSAREQDPALDSKAAALDQSYCQILRLVNNLEAFQALARPRPLQNADVAALASEVFSSADELARFRGLKTRFLCPAGTHVCLCSPDALRQALGQMLSNAFKFTPPGGSITLELSFIQGQICLAVADTGPGIPPEERLTLFSRWRSEPALTSSHGLGLGLAICQRAAELHDGSITLDPSTKQGARFVLSFPDRKSNLMNFSDIPAIYADNGFGSLRTALADALPAEAFLRGYQP